MSRLWKSACRLGGVLLLVAVSLSVAPPAVADDADHLLLTEVNVDWRTGVGSRYVEIHNPTVGEVALGDVYLSNASNSANQYYNIVTFSDAGGGVAGKFHCRFPLGATIAAGDTVVVAIEGSEMFEDVYGFLPDFELYEDDSEPDEVADMMPVFTGSIGEGLVDPGSNTPTFLYSEGALVLYRWDGASDLVEDLDYICWGAGTGDRIDKSGILIDGPDGDETDSVYADDTPIASQDAINPGGTHTFAQSFQRHNIDEGTEVLTGGNGEDGHDETSENLATTWQIAAYAPAAPPTTPVSPAPFVTELTLTPAAPVADVEATISATVSYYDAPASVTFWYSLNGGGWIDVAGADAGSGVWTATVPGQPDGTVLSWYVEVFGSGDTDSVFPPAGAHEADSATFSEAPEPGDGPAHLLITEVNYNYPEFIEIYNPTAADVPLGDYYLTDGVYYQGQGYWNLVTPNPQQSTVGGGLYYDFTARMPEDLVIGAGQYVTVSISGSSDFAASYAFMPSCELYEDDTTTDDVPDMREVFDGSIDGTDIPTLSNFSDTGGEIVVLFYWDGTTDLMTDIDVFAWGNGTNYHLDKGGVSVDGPDADGDASAYADDAGTSGNHMASAVGSGETYQRAAGFSEGSETTTGGNGVGGHDETSENVGTTFISAEADPAEPVIVLPEGATAGAVVKVPARTFLPTLGGTFPIRFTSLPNSRTLVRVFDLEGRAVITLFDNLQDGSPAVVPGTFTRVNWDGRDTEFERLPVGTYIVHLSVTEEATGDLETATAPVVIATRLK